MIQVARMIGEKDSENKGLLLKIVGGAVLFLGSVIAVTAGILGSNTQLTKNGDNDNSDNDGSSIEV